MAREGLRVPLRTALHKAVATHERVVQKQVPVQTNGGVTNVELTVEPIAELEGANLYIIVFEDAAAASANATQRHDVFDASAQETIRHLESELQAAQEHAQAVFEELESSNEELKSANEEYQSTNEELETSKEEVQSFNEELETVNAELNRRVAELDHANSDLLNLNASTQIATIFLDGQLHIKSFTPAAGSVFRLIPGDVGRPITDLTAQFANADFADDIRDVLRTLVPRERDLPGTDKKHYLMRMLPYRTVQNVIDGVVITFTDVTQLKEAEKLAADAKQAAHDARVYAENIVDTVREPLLILDADLRVKSANNAFYTVFGVSPTETINRPLADLGNRQWDIPELRLLLNDILPAKKKMEDFRVEHQFPQIGKKVMLLNAREILQQNGGARLILLAIEDVTESTYAQDELRRTDEELRTVNADLQHFAYAASHDLQEPLRMVTSYTQLLAKRYKGKLDKMADLSIGYAVEGAQRMEMLLKGLRDYWAVNEGKMERTSVADTAHAFQEALTYLEVPIAQSSAIITHDPLPQVAAEELLLTLLFKNLIGNALKYVRPGEPPRIHVSAHLISGTWNFSVQDNGIGIATDHLGTIFAPFKRLHGAEEYAGSGLGLAICQRIVERYKGRIWVESQPGQGSTFWFTIPVQIMTRNL